MASTKTKGNITELYLAAKLMQNGFVISFPFGENSRYDLIIERGGELFKVQCKTGKFKDGAIVISTRSTKSYRNLEEVKNKVETYQGQVDFIASYCPQLDKCYLIPISECKDFSIKLRVDDAKNNQVKGITPAAQYELK
jgi:hypothetical protein